MRVEIIDITDRSGSMSSLRNDVITGFNLLLDEQKQVDGQARLTHVQFDDEYSLRYAGSDIQIVEMLTTDTYQPRGCTALLDAIGRTLQEQGKRIALENWAEKVIVSIRTDGMENASKEYTKSKIKEMIEHAESHGWVFIFSAANQDAFTTGSSYGISGTHTQTFRATGQGVAESYAFATSTMTSLRADPTEQTKLQQAANLQVPLVNIIQSKI